MWAASLPRLPGPCISVRWWRRSGAISRRGRRVATGWCGWRISMRRAMCRARPTISCAPWRLSASSGRAKCSGRAGGSRLMQRHWSNCRRSVRPIPALVRARKLPTARCVRRLMGAMSIRAPVVQACLPTEHPAPGVCASMHRQWHLQIGCRGCRRNVSNGMWATSCCCGLMACSPISWRSWSMMHIRASPMLYVVPTCSIPHRARSGCTEVWAWARAHWQLGRVPRQRSLVGSG